MTNRITTHAEYESTFNGDVRERAFECALDIRKFEIELYWKRTTYFWTLLTGTFAGYFALATAEEKQSILIFLISCIGLVLSTGWYLVNRGSKYWQENWERHVDSLEDEIVGPLYKTTISNEQFPWHKALSGYRYSVSKVNQIISLFVSVLWFGITITSFPTITATAFLGNVTTYALAFITIGFIALLLFFGRSRPQGGRRVDFRVSELVTTGCSGQRKVEE